MRYCNYSNSSGGDGDADADGSSSSSSTSRNSNKCKLECGPMPNVMAALPNIGGALCSTPQSLADAHYLTAMQ